MLGVMESRGMQAQWSADSQAFVVSGWEQEKHPRAQAASISPIHTRPPFLFLRVLIFLKAAVMSSVVACQITQLRMVSAIIWRSD